MDTLAENPAPLSSRIRIDDDGDTSSISDYESEWTQISQSGDESDASPYRVADTDESSSHRDVDSVDGFDWMGEPDEPGPESSVIREHIELTLPPPVAADEMPRAISPVASVHEDDLRLNEALDASMASTLEVARSRLTSPTPDDALTASQSRLRLSFPDPLMRSNEDISRSYEDVDTTQSMVATPNTSDQEGDITFPDTSSATVDPGFTPTPAATSDVHEVTASTVPINYRVIASIVLYGYKSQKRWSVAESVARMAFHVDHEAIVCKGNTRAYAAEHVGSVAEAVQIIDHTGTSHLVSRKFHVSLTVSTSFYQGRWSHRWT